MKKELKKTIYETVSTLRNVFVKLKVMLEEETRQKNQKDRKINVMKIELDARSRANINTVGK